MLTKPTQAVFTSGSTSNYVIGDIPAGWTSTKDKYATWYLKFTASGSFEISTKATGVDSNLAVCSTTTIYKTITVSDRAIDRSTLTVKVSPSLSGVRFKVDGVDHSTSGGSFNVELNPGTHQVQLVDTIVKDGEDTEHRFKGWSGIGSGSANPIKIDITASSTLTADFSKYYKVVFTQSGGEGTLQVTVDGTAVPLPKALWLLSGSQHSFKYEPASGGIGIRSVPTSTSHESPITVDGPVTVTATYETQYYVTVNSEHGERTRSQWVDKGSSLVTTVTSPADDNGAGTRYRCTGHKINDANPQPGTSHTFNNIQTPQTIDYQWTPQYCLTLNTDPADLNPQPTLSPSGSWHDAGTSVTCTAQTVDNSRFSYWLLDGVPQENTELVITMDKPHEATAHYAAANDLNFDGKVDETDMLIITAAFQSKPGDIDYDPRMDFDNNGIISIIDVSVVAKDFD